MSNRDTIRQLAPMMARLTSVNMVVRIMAMSLMLATSVVLARLLGPTEFGAYGYALTVVSLASMPAILGLPTLATREVAKFRVLGQARNIDKLMRWCAIIAFAAGIIATVLVVGVALWRDPTLNSTLSRTMLVGAPLVLLVAWLRIVAAKTRGFDKVASSQIPEAVLRPTLICAAAVFAFHYLGWSPKGETALAMNVIATLIASIVATFLVAKIDNLSRNHETAPDPSKQLWFASLMPLALISGMQMINQNTDTLMIGFWEPLDSVAYYRIAGSVASLVVVVSSVLTMVVQPKLSAFYTTGDMDKFVSIVRIAAVAGFITAMPGFGILLFYGEELVSLVYGPEYTPAVAPLLILIGAQLFNVFVGPVIAVLNMTGHERSVAFGIGLSAILNLLLNAILIPMHGIEGAAIATGISIVFWNSVLWRKANMIMGTDGSAFSALTVGLRK